MNWLKSALLVLLFFSSLNANAQAGLTILAVKSALEGAITEMRNALAEATSDLQSLGNSLQANAQNVILDIDRTLGSKINLTFDRLDATELRLVEDAQALTSQMRTAATKVIAKAGEEARATIVEADITAYNASYSLPCRDSKPRLVASFPGRLVTGRSTPLLTLRGNFLRQGNLIASVNGKPARIVERLDRQMSVEIPGEIMMSAINDGVLLSTRIDGFEEIERNVWLWGLLGCHENRKTTSQSPIGLSMLEPPFSYTVTGTVKLTYTGYHPVAEAAQTFSNTGSNQCDDNYRVDQQWCIQGPGRIVNAAVTVTSSSCNSGYEGNTPSGDRCVLVRGKVAGCGANRGPFNTWLGCRGRGWLNYTIQLTRSEPFPSETPTASVNIVGEPGTTSFNIPLPSSAGLDSPSGWYALQVIAKQGRKAVNTYAVSHANPNSGPVTSRAHNGVLGVEVAR